MHVQEQPHDSQGQDVSPTFKQLSVLIKPALAFHPSITKLCMLVARQRVHVVLLSKQQLPEEELHLEAGRQGR
jgi:hypothetical protein